MTDAAATAQQQINVAASCSLISLKSSSRKKGGKSVHIRSRSDDRHRGTHGSRDAGGNAPLRTWRDVANEFNRRHPHEPPMRTEIARATGLAAMRKLRRQYPELALYLPGTEDMKIRTTLGDVYKQIGNLPHEKAKHRVEAVLGSEGMLLRITAGVRLFDDNTIDADANQMTIAKSVRDDAGSAFIGDAPDQWSAHHLATLDAMERIGGDFIRSLAWAWRKADASNHAKLYSVFGREYTWYANQAKKFGEQKREN